MRADARYQKQNHHNGTNQTTIQRICGVTDYTDLIPSIPSVPMGYGEAQQILARASWRPKSTTRV